MHWCPHLRTVLSEIEVEYLQLDGPTDVPLPGREAAVEFGVMHHFAYRIVSEEDSTAGGDIEVRARLLESMHD